jgi:hypothetical protein
MHSLRGQMRLREGNQTQGRGLEPRPTEDGHPTGLGSQWCNRLPSIPYGLGEEGVVWAVWTFRHLPDMHL